MSWDATQYLKFADERSRPFFDLQAQVRGERFGSIVDLGCGPGQLTRHLAERWPDAVVTGVDNSAEMLATAKEHALPGRLDFVQADIAAWQSSQPLDLIFTNAALQWVPDHAALLSRLVGMLAPGGTLAVQVPDRFLTPAQEAIEETAADPRWAAQLAGVGLHRESVQPLAWYVRRLRELGLTVDAWQTTYLHQLTGPNAVLEWFRGTALRPLLAKLGEQRGEFEQALAVRLAALYPAEGGVTLFAFPRIFFVAIASRRHLTPPEESPGDRRWSGPPGAPSG